MHDVVCIEIKEAAKGRINRVYVAFTGKLVKKNRPLLSLYSPELVSAQQELLMARKGGYFKPR